MFLHNANWNYPTTIWFGNGRIKELNEACKKLNIQKPLLVTDPNLAKSNMFNTILKNNNFLEKINIFSNIKGNPLGKNIEDGVKVFKKNNCDGVIAFGGGSGLDVGKTIAFMSGQNRPVWDFEDVGDYWMRADANNIVPIVAVPTTAGTGSETGRASAIINEKTNEKKIIFHPKMMPSIVILDPELTLNLPADLTATTGMDALAHNLEAFLAKGFHPFADGIALQGMLLVKQFLPIAFKNGKNLEARSCMLVAASMGSTAFQKGLGAIHSLSHPINSVFNIHHGLTNAIFMPYVITFNRKAIEKKVIEICKYLQLENDTFDGFLNWILKLRKELNIPHTLSEVIDVKKIDLKKLSSMALKDPSTAGNPKDLSLDDMKIMYEYSLKGKLF